jgi:hypothetical protein
LPSPLIFLPNRQPRAPSYRTSPQCEIPSSPQADPPCLISLRTRVLRPPRPIPLLPSLPGKALVKVTIVRSPKVTVSATVTSPRSLNLRPSSSPAATLQQCQTLR